MHVTGSIALHDLYLCSYRFVMAPFEPPESVLTGFKERIEAISLQGISIQSVTLTQLICLRKETASM